MQSARLLYILAVAMIFDVHHSSKEVVDLFRKILGTDEIDENSEVGKPHQWNSLHHIELILALEQKYSLKVGAQGIAALTSIRAVTEFLKSQSKL
jgi:acyl carrier protein